MTVALPGSGPATTKERTVTVKTHKYMTARSAARRPQYLYRDSHGADVLVVDARDCGQLVELTLADGRTFPVDWDHKLRVVRS